MYDLIIVGGGPAGVAAGVYAARKRLATLFITNEWGGQSTVSTDIQNWIGTPSISGAKLASDFKTHLETFASDVVTVIGNRTVVTLTKNEDGTNTVTTNKGEAYTGKAVLIATGSKRRALDVPGAKELEHRGLTYCASCDGPMFSDMDVVVVGGGNAGFETAAQLAAYCRSVTLLHRGPQFRAEAITVEKVTALPNVRAFKNATPTRILGEQFVSGIEYRTETGEVVTLPTSGIFVEIGMIPNTEFAARAVTRDEMGRTETDPWTQRTTAPATWAAGACTNGRYHQNNIAAGDGVRALEDIFVCLRA